MLLLSVACSGQHNGRPASSSGAVAAPAELEVEVDSARVVDDLRFLSNPDLEGRASGSEGNRIAREYVQAELTRAGVEPFEFAYLREFTRDERGSSGFNVVGVVRGTAQPERFIVVTAHYDHLGVVNGDVFPGADDNASGVAALLELARLVASRPLPSSIIFAALDAEESGLRGARAFVADPPVPLESIFLNINLDMISRNEADELYIAGTHHYPELAPLAQRIADRSELTVLFGHDRPGLPPGADWTHLSDHAAFHAAGIPFIYFGVEDHADYHRPSDTFENTDPAFFVRAVETVLDFLRVAAGS